MMSIAIGVLSSLVSSLLFLYFLQSVKPKLKISPFMAEANDLEGNRVFKFKVVNKTSRPILNIKASCQVVYPRIGFSDNLNTTDMSANGVVKTISPIPLHINNFPEVARFSKLDSDGDYAFRVKTYKNIRRLLENSKYSYVRFTVSATDSFSGFSKTFIGRFDLDAIRIGDFNVRDSLSVSPKNLS